MGDYKGNGGLTREQFLYNETKTVCTVSHGKSDMIGGFRLESQMLPENGKFDRTGLGRSVQSSMVVIGDFSIGGTIMKAENLASTLQVCLDSGAIKYYYHRYQLSNLEQYRLSL